MHGRGRIGTRLVAALVVAVILAAGAMPALAQPALTTSYPEVDVAAGEEIDFDLLVDAPAGERVQLAVTDVPEGWEARLRAAGYNVRAVTAGADGPAEVTLEVSVPPDAGEQSHTVTVEATSPDGSSQLDLDLRVTEAATAAVSLDTEFATLQGGPEDTFGYDIELSNDIPEEVTFALQAAGPGGWEVSATPSTQARANTVTVPAGGTATIDVEATPPPGVTAGEYPLGLQATGGGRTAEVQLIAEVTGSPQLSLTTANERLDASGTAGDATTIDLVVNNPGSAPLTGVELSAGPPSGWEVAFEPSNLEVIPPGESVGVQATVTPDNEAVVGDYVVSLTGSSEEREDQIEVRFGVGTSATWGITPVVLIVLVILGLFGVFRRYGRR